MRISDWSSDVCSSDLEQGRIALCGAIAVYNATEPVPGPRNLLLMIWRRLRMEGFLVGDHDAVRPQFLAEMTELVRRGEVTSPEIGRASCRERVCQYV